MEIGDESGNSFRVLVDMGRVGLGGASGTRGTWRTLDKGAIKFNSGSARFSASQSQMDDYYLELYSTPQATQWGIRLNEYAGRLVVNDDGMDLLAQAWCVTAKPGRISWVLAD